MTLSGECRGVMAGLRLDRSLVLTTRRLFKQTAGRRKTAEVLRSRGGRYCAKEMTQEAR